MLYYYKLIKDLFYLFIYYLFGFILANIVDQWFFSLTLFLLKILGMDSELCVFQLPSSINSFSRFFNGENKCTVNMELSSTQVFFYLSSYSSFGSLSILLSSSITIPMKKIISNSVNSLIYFSRIIYLEWSFIISSFLKVLYIINFFRPFILYF